MLSRGATSLLDGIDQVESVESTSGFLVTKYLNWKQMLLTLSSLKFTARQLLLK